MLATAGETVSIHYIGTLDSGRIFESTTDAEPLAFTVGEGEIFPKLEEAILSMQVGEVKNICIASSDAFGPRQQNNIIRVHRSVFPPEKEIRVGQKLTIEFRGNRERVMIVTAVDADDITLDGNHPLAGQDLTFALKVVSVS